MVYIISEEQAWKKGEGSCLIGIGDEGAGKEGIVGGMELLRQRTRSIYAGEFFDKENAS